MSAFESLRAMFRGQEEESRAEEWSELLSTPAHHPLTWHEKQEILRWGFPDPPTLPTDGYRASIPETRTLRARTCSEKRLMVVPIATLGYCPFCLKNGEPAEYYMSHNLRNFSGSVSCPKLRAYKCSRCGNQGGDTAHTLNYCPILANPKKPNLMRLVRRDSPR